MAAHTAGPVFYELSLCLDKMRRFSVTFLVLGDATLQCAYLAHVDEDRLTHCFETVLR